MADGLKDIAQKLGIEISATGVLKNFSPLDGKLIAEIENDTPASLNKKTKTARAAQQNWVKLSLQQRADALLQFAELVEKESENLAAIINIEAGKTVAEGAGEAANFATTIQKTIATVLDQKFDDFNNVKRRKTYHPVGVVGVITSFNFPLAVASWSIAPALLTGNAVLWKPSEKTPLIALAIKAIYQKSNLPEGLFDVVIGDVEIGKNFVAHDDIGMISATGSVAMGKSILDVLSKKTGNLAAPILELGGNNGVIISNNNELQYIEQAVDSIIKSFTGSCGQRCTNTRRLFVHADVYDNVLEFLKSKLDGFEPDTPLIDEAAYNIYQNAVAAARQQGGEILLGGSVDGAGFYVKPTLALMPKQTEIMYEECFAPLLYVVKYDDFAAALEQVNAPENAGLVNGIYTQNSAEAELFAKHNGAGHTVINTVTGTGTPAHGLGFGGNKSSGMGEVLNQQDPLKPFSKAANRVVVNLEVPIN